MHSDSKSSFNIIHFESAFKIDIFIPNSEFEKQIFTRKRKNKIEEKINKDFSIVSPEDIILLKLKWYMQSGCVLDRQWSDITGILSVQKNL